MNQKLFFKPLKCFKPFAKPAFAALLALLFSCVLPGCANYAEQPNYDLDRLTLNRSAAFTQRELINQALKEPNHSDAERKTALVNSYCDLAYRSIIYISPDKTPDACHSLGNRQRSCAYKMHICIRNCPLRAGNCEPCIDRARECLTE